MERGDVDMVAHLATSFTLMGLLASMDPLVDGECRSLNKLLPTTWVVANMWSDTAVNTLCYTTLERFPINKRVLLTMAGEVTSPGEPLATGTAWVGLRSGWRSLRLVCGMHRWSHVGRDAW